ncbi:hypothetical protein LMG28688_01669 [Paraburkholderia caffeinitolerans]|uniref:Uncharacterized protein n=1 Tax=Paraburkholderia caffeinitolerans TaxID=1723730 RepID=A0A6J5FRS7_9BURK|nr:hypothetical protein [Paraburkholderia caffeinitolerans]CAB3783547.1 hypothetical protein LMG28688_01669 [Paraburkholderia caffeinitolerans]
MDIIDRARASGLTVILDGRIGREEYQSVCGSISALQRFAESLLQCTAEEQDSAPHRSTAFSAADRASGQSGRRINKLARMAGAMATPARRMSRIAHWRRK